MMASCSVCKTALPGGGVAEIECPTCGHKPERNQPPGTASDGRLFNMKEPGYGQDMGGNPLQEGILGDWQNPHVRDESFASVAAREVSNEMWPSETLDMSVDMPWTVRTAGTTQATIEPRGGIHNGPIKMLQFLDASIDGLSCRTQSRDILMKYSPFNREGWEEQKSQAVRIDVPHDEYIPAARDIVEAGRQPGNNGELLKQLAQSMKTGTVPYPPGINPEQVQASVNKTAGGLLLKGLQLAKPLLPKAIQAGGKALPAGLKAKATGAVNFASKASLMNNVGNLLGGGGGGGGGQQAAPSPIRGFDQLAHTASQVLGLETPSSVPFIGTGGPEDVDQHEFNADSNIHNLYDPTTNESGSSQKGLIHPDETTGNEELDQWIDALPEILHYYESEEPGIQNPKLRKLWERLQAEQSHASKSANQPSYPPNQVQTPGTGVVPQAPHGTQGAGLQGEQPGQGRCPNCGGVLGANGQCPQCGAAAPALPTQGLQQPGVGATPGQAGIGQMQQTGPTLGRTALHDHQGPRNSEQFAAVAELLRQEARDEEVVTMLKQPWDYADELAAVQQKSNKPPLDESTSEGQPAQEEAPPGATMPVPDPTMAPQQGIAAALNKAGADSAAPRCPQCDSATTKILDGDGNCECHRCNHQWKSEDAVEEKISAQKESVIPGRLPHPTHPIPYKGERPVPRDNSTWMPEHEAPWLDRQNATPEEFAEWKQVYQKWLDKEHDPAQETYQKAYEEKNTLNTQKGEGQGPGIGPSDFRGPKHVYFPEGHQLKWQPGDRGRGAFINDKLHTWQTNEPTQEDPHGGLMHGEYVKQFGPNAEFEGGFEIDPDGSLVGGDEVHDKAQAVDPNLVPTKGVFNFSNTREAAPPEAPEQFVPHNPVKLPAADQDAPDREETDTSRSWATKDGDPLRVGDTYELHSAKFSIPDIVKIDAIKPDSLDVTIIGEYSARGDDAELSHQIEIPRQEAEVERYEFIPADYTDSENQPDHENPGEPTAAPGEVTDLSSPHSKVTSGAENPDLAWILGDEGGLDFSEFETRDARTAGAKFSPSQQRGFIDEEGTARNSDKLELEGTHYTTRFDPTASADEVPDDHLGLGLL